ncbi:MAG: PTS transporter subunit EIIC [Coriobacteriia bacterium]|nr:PTS transporter subunit EIIC [Coriobacteriia bacterium]
MADVNKLVDEILECVGGKKNVKIAQNCMTRLRLTFYDGSKVEEEKLKSVSGVLGVVHDSEDYYEVVVGPGVSKKCADRCKEIGIGKNNEEWKENKAAVRGKPKGFKAALKVLGEIFVPLIPAIISAGVCGGFASIISSCVPNYQDNTVVYSIYILLMLIKTSFLSFLGIYVGYRTAERFGGTPALGAMIGMITHLEMIALFADVVGFDEIIQGFNFLKVGSGGVLAALIGAICVAKLEQFIRKFMPENIDMIFTPLLTVGLVTIVYVMVIMPAAGFVSDAIGYFVQITIMSDNVFIKGVAGFISAALFLPLVAMGMHHALIPIYTIQLESLGYITLYPALTMGGFGQIGAALIIYFFAKKYNNNHAREVIAGSIFAGILGVGEPLIYGVSVPLMRPFISAGLGAGFGGAIVTIFGCASTSWGPSGLLGVTVVNAGPLGPVMCIAVYLIAGLVSVVMAMIFSWFILDRKAIKEF